ncbi:hypothetical protein VPHK290_0024 [Vibrio phage K290]
MSLICLCDQLQYFFYCYYPYQQTCHKSMSQVIIVLRVEETPLAHFRIRVF